MAESKSYDLNSVTFIGRLGADPIVRTIASGKKVADMRIAISDGERTVWIDATAWDKTADAIERFSHKGQRVGVMGRLTLDEWDDKETGQRRSKIKVTATSVQFLSFREDDDASRPAREPARRERQPARQPVRGEDTRPLKDYGLDDEVPF